MSRWLIPLLLVLLLGACTVSLLAGTVWLSPARVLASLTTGRVDLPGLIVAQIRMPRLVLALAIGASLGLSGAVLQGLTRNPLAEPGLLGITAGGSLGAVIAIYFEFATGFALATPMFALAGAFGTALIALLLARRGGNLSLILTGVAISSIASAVTMLALNLAPDPFANYEIMAWLMGTLADRYGRKKVLLCTIAVTLIGSIVTLHPILWIKITGLLLLTFGFFGSHSIASSWVGRRATHDKAQASSLYLFFYYAGSSIGGTVAGLCWSAYGWKGVIALIGVFLTTAFFLAVRLSKMPAQQTHVH